MFKRLMRVVKQNNYFVFTFIGVAAVIFWYLNFSAGGRAAFGGWFYFLNFLFFLVYLLFNSLWLGKILARFGFEKELQFVFGVFLLIFLIAFGMAVPIVLYKIKPFYLFGLLLFLNLFISFWAKKIKSEEGEQKFPIQDKDKPFFKISKRIYVLLVAVCCFALFLLFYSRTGEYIRSPWEIIHPLYFYCWLAIISILGLLIFTGINFKKYLLIVILVSLLFHAYLLIPYQMGFGGDKWRHLGAEKWLMEGKIYTPAAFGEEISYRQIGPLKIPEVFVVGNKTSYANMWGLTIALSWLTGLDVFWTDLLLGVLLFSIFLPFLLLKIGSFFCRKKEFLLLLVFCSFLFYPFQAYGSITVPLTFAFLPFLFALIFLLKYLVGSPLPYKRPQWGKGRELFLIILFFIPFLYLNYALYLVLFLEVLLLAIIFRNIGLGVGKRIYIPLLIFCFILLLFFIPLLETADQLSWFKYPFPSKMEISGVLKNFPVRLLFSQAIFPRVYQYEQDNWLYAITEEGLSRSAILRILPWAFVLTPLIWFLAVFGVVHYRKLERPNVGWLFFSMLPIVFINQMTAVYFMEGNHIFTKRLVVFASFLFLFPLAWSIYRLSLSRFFRRKAVILTLILLLAFTAVTVYASGPKFQVVTADEFKAAEYVWRELSTQNEVGVGKQGIKNYCVLANTWPLLALEAISSRQITTGGFPYYYEYRQPERVQLFDNMNKNPSIRYLEKSLEITGADECYFMTEERWIDFEKRKKVVEQVDKILGPHQNIGKVMIWRYQPTN